MSARDWSVIGLAVIYSAIALLIRHRAARHFRPGVSAWTRRGVGWGMLRRDNYTMEGQSARRWLVGLWIGAVPLFVVLVWLLTGIDR